VGKGNLLIVDDEPLLLKRLKMNLEEYADQIFTAKDGVEALEIFAREEIHCIICDINMPRMNGVEVIKEIRRQKSEVPFIFYTGHGHHGLMMEAAKYGAFDFLNKPDLDGLEEVISRGLELGFTRLSKEDSPSDHISEYQKLLLQLD
jgi:two-component system, NtrC family, response regulator AtoC